MGRFSGWSGNSRRPRKSKFLSLTPLHFAVSERSKDGVELLIAKGADVNAENEMNETPLHVAAGHGWKELAELFISQGANVKARSRAGLRPWHYAERAGHKDLAELLRKHGGRPRFYKLFSK